MKEDGPWRRPLAWIKQRSPPVHHFLTRKDKPFPLVREGIGIFLFLVLLAAVLWGSTGQPFLRESPVVVVESGSMMHCDPEFVSLGRTCERADGVGFGRIGTIDPGDLIFVRDVGDRGDVEAYFDSVGACEPLSVDSYLDCHCDGGERQGACGDVIIYQKSDVNDPTPVIHRAMFYLQIHGDGTYSIDMPDKWDCPDLLRVAREGLQSNCLARLGVNNLHNHHYFDLLGAADSGFITRGDNNRDYDQNNPQIEPMPVIPDRILGKARGELPWLGLVKLFVSDITVGTSNFSNASGDAKAMMWVSLGVIIGTPAVIERVQRFRQKRDEEAP